MTKKTKSQFEQIEEAINDPKGIQVFVLEKPEAPKPLDRPQHDPSADRYSKPLWCRFTKSIMSLRICEPFINDRSAVIRECIEFTHPKFGALRITVTDEGKIEILADSGYKFDNGQRMIKADFFGDPY